VAEFGSLHQLIVMHVIFGKALEQKHTFISSDVTNVIKGDLDRANTIGLLDRLTRQGWLKLTAVPEMPRKKIGRPPQYGYERTDKGRAEYNALVTKLAKYGISLG